MRWVRVTGSTQSAAEYAPEPHGERTLGNSPPRLAGDVGVGRPAVGNKEPAGGDEAAARDGTLGLLQDLLTADLGFHGANGKFATHGWHPFPAKFPPQLPQFFIEHLSQPGQTVLDPMSGSGTTLVEAQRLGRHAVGCDIDPLARLISATKLKPVSSIDALRSGRSVLAGARRDSSSRRDQLETDLGTRFDGKTRDFLDYWFLPDRQLELLALLRRIEDVESQDLRRFLQLVFSSTIIAKSGGVSLARDLAHTRPHRVLDKATPSAFAAFEKRLNANAVPQCVPSSAIPVEVLAASANDTGLAPASVDLVVTSPPYANNAIDYMRAHKFSLVWFGWTLDALTDIRKTYLGHDAPAPEIAISLPDRCDATLARLAELDARKARVLRRYFCEMSEVLAEMHRVLRHGGAAVMVVGTSTLRGMDVETHKALAAIAERQGFASAGIGVRGLDRDRRMMPARWGGSRGSQIEQRMHEEYVVGLVKP